MNAFQTCRNTTDAVPLYLPQQLFLKPIARVTISISLPNLKKLEKSVSHWEIMEKIRSAIHPDEFSQLKVVKTTLEFIRFEGELDNKTRLDRVISKLDCHTIKLKEIPDLLRLRASETKSDYPTRHKWDTFFQDAKDMDEMKPGQRPDTMHLSNLPIKWFVPYHMSEEEDINPSEKMFFRIFEKFGPIRYVDIPICDPYRSKMKDHISGIKEHKFDDKKYFEGYVQFKDYIGFCNAMDAFKGMKLLRKEDDEALCVNIKVDFDRSKHLSDASIRRREIVRDRLVRKQREKEEKEKNTIEEKRRNETNERQKEVKEKFEKEQRRREREQKRKAKILEKLKINGCDEINEKIAKEEKKLTKAQRKLEAIRLVEELFRRIKEKKGEEYSSYKKLKKRTENDNELQTFKNKTELELLTQRQNLHSALEGRVILKSILSGKRSRSNSSSSSESSTKKKNFFNQEVMFEPWYNYNYSTVPPPTFYQPIRGHPANFLISRGRNNRPGPSRGRGRPFQRRGFVRGGGHYKYAPELEKQYFKYFSKFLSEHDYRRSRSRSRRRSRSNSYSRSRSRSRSYKRRSRTRSPSRFTPPFSRSVSKSKSRSRSRSRSRSKTTRDRSSRRKYSRSTSRKRSKSRSKRNTRSFTRSRSKSRTIRERSKSKNNKPRLKTRTPSPKPLREPRSRSRSKS